MSSAGDQAINNQQLTINNSPSPIAWTVAGSDSGGGAGIQADLKVMNAFGVHGCSVVTAVTAQNTVGVDSVETVSASMLRAQLEALRSDLPPVAMKTGMLGSTANCSVLADFLASPDAVQPALICDPIIQSTSGTDLLDPEALDILLKGIMPHAGVLTPNLPETEKLLGRNIDSVEKAAEMLLERGAQSVLIKGGHREGGVCRDYWTDGSRAMWLTSPRIETRATHGTGCILSAAITSAIAIGRSMPDAVITAKTYLNQCLRSSAGLGAGPGPMQIRPFLNEPQDKPGIQ
jgi:hydroxymethylpyrimidine kinase/phosphomethylpyrimidine kinase/thiamine-phosphate diphosphorylase